MNLTIDFYEPQWQQHRIVCQCYVQCAGVNDTCRDALQCVSTECVSTACISTGCDTPGDTYIEKHIALTELERYIADVYHYTGQYYDSGLEEYFDKEPWDSVLYDLQLILDRREGLAAIGVAATCVETHCNASLREDEQQNMFTPLPNIPVIIKELIVVKDVA